MINEARKRVLWYAIAVNLVILVTGVGFLFPDLSGDALLGLYLLAVAGAAWKGGKARGALLAMVLSVVALAAAFRMTDFQSLAIFVGGALIIVVIAAAGDDKPAPAAIAPDLAPVLTFEPNGKPVACFHCGVAFDVMEADWCSCLTKERTLVCTNCLTCFCKAPPSYHEQFWAGAPPGLRALKKTEHARIENPPLTGVARPLVMLVEPDEEIQAIVHRVCNNLGYGFVLAKDGQDGLELALHYRPNLILAEAFLPKLDGREVCRVLKLDGSDFRAVVLTGLYTDTRYRSEALERFRVDDYATKPVSITELINLLEKHLEGVTGLPGQEDLHEQHRREIAPPQKRLEHYEILCANCGRPFDAARAAWCADNDPTLVCSACGHCFCEAAPSYRERFWSEAPPLLFERKTIVANRARGMRPKDVKRPLVLLADGDENMELIVRTVATTLGYGFVAAAKEKAGEYNPDLVLSGRELPKPLEVDDVMQVLRKPASQ